MIPRAFTPLFRWLELTFPRAPRPGVSEYPAPRSGNHAGEAGFLALATGLLTSTWAVPATSSLSSNWARIPAVAVLLFIVPQLIMAVISLVSPAFASPRLPRETTQDWSCLAVMTAWAIYRSPGPGWEAWTCKTWLAFAALNAVLWPFTRRPPPDIS